MSYTKGFAKGLVGTAVFAAAVVYLASQWGAHKEDVEQTSKEVSCKAFAYSQYEYWRGNRMLPNEGLIGSQWVHGYSALLNFQRHIKSPEDAFNASYTWCMRR